MALTAVVLVSGGDTQTPFTTPTEACRTGLPAGLTHTALRRALLDAGRMVFTVPSMNGPGPVHATPGFGDFAAGPDPLPADVTVNTVDAIDVGGAHLAAFLGHLHDQHGVGAVHLVGHSMGGMFSRSAARRVRADGGTVVLRSLTTLGTPWRGCILGDVLAGAEDRAVLAGQKLAETMVDGLAEAARARPGGMLPEISCRFIDGTATEPGWNAAQAGALDGVPVTLLAGDHCRVEGGDPRVWPNDGLVPATSQLAEHVDPAVVPGGERHRFDVVHSLTICEALGLADEWAMTWNPGCLAAAVAAVEAAGD